MIPNEYYENFFETDLKAFLDGIALTGSKSIAINVSRGVSGVSTKTFSAWDLSAKDSWRFMDSRPEQKSHFLFALGYTVMVDMVLFTYFKPAYPEWSKLSAYPKMYGTLSSGWSLVPPDSLFNSSNLSAAEISWESLGQDLAAWVDFMIADLEESLPKLDIGVSSMDFFQAFIGDPDLNCEPWSRKLHSALRVKVGSRT